MTYTQFTDAVEAAKAYPTAEEYIDANAYPEREISPRLQIARARILWNFAAGRPALEIVRAAGMTATAFCKKYQIARRTFDNWSNGVRMPPAHVLPPLVYALISDIV